MLRPHYSCKQTMPKSTRTGILGMHHLNISWTSVILHLRFSEKRNNTFRFKTVWIRLTKTCQNKTNKRRAMPTLLTKVADETVAAGNHATGNEEETTSKRKQDSPVVSPGKKKQKADGQETIDKYYERELNATKYLKNLEVLSTKNLLKEDPVVVTVRDVGYGLWSFIQINKFGTNDEPNTIQCLYHALGLVSYTKTKRSPGEMDFAKEVNIFYAAPRRLSREKENEISHLNRFSLMCPRGGNRC